MAKSELVELARDGDRDAIDVLMTQVIDHLCRVARLILRATTSPKTPSSRHSFGAGVTCPTFVMWIGSMRG